jgi:pyruvate dehydrogenase E2 component (dihydrolipoamide acetyltransferase)
VTRGPPWQAGILAIGGTQRRVVRAGAGAGALGVEEVMTVTLSADHRVIDGEVAGAFLEAFAANLSNPIRLLGA